MFKLLYYVNRGPTKQTGMCIGVRDSQDTHLVRLFPVRPDSLMDCIQLTDTFGFKKYNFVWGIWLSCEFFDILASASLKYKKTLVCCYLFFTKTLK